ncbi:MAG: hypothetical protein A2508_07470 [Candidatus Lambdaproteobacteria bacterium RIFOXYD12_FULL_49_8]|uniref:Outer membrane protein beta-barrel domain-containing protein n=1 Tax=Candidatus Lambdaproteobacteria bacterium RIFOXYD2_FULL_50_16 TaxID=1817772 RepID=A0A1F6GFW5_9PROT|nr:MAG: hypothetical protein A2527_02785 [Candidatus Lambdaproteobacteria bacterium RIFOXYD2_FULL_50_16]OGG98154.1 MAG: hypothetical protein A2508_07470 [Candidatus Lambdaproteobacteria bacterium RIFOXYD12_FULL_49_8]
MKPVYARLPRVVWCLLIGGIICLCSASKAIAQNADSSVGFSIGINSSPEEKGLDRAGQSSEVYLDFMQLRIGYNKISSYLNTSIYQYDWSVKLTTESYFAAWKPGEPDAPFYVLAGISYTVPKLSLGNGIADRSTQDWGYLFGGGMMFNLDSFFLGLQYMVFSSQSIMGDLTMATGSSQLQLSTRIPF